jgi:hypothetical protein
MNDLEVQLQIWKELKPHLIGGDVEAAADDFIHVLLEHGADANEIMKYAVDSDLKLVLRDHADEEHFEDDLDDADEFDYITGGYDD